MKFLICTLIVLTGLTAHLFAPVQKIDRINAASVAAFPTPSPAASCPNRSKLKNLCMMIGDHMKVSRDPIHTGKHFYETRPGITYMYEQRFVDAACVLESDSKEVKYAKIRDVWARYEDDLVCTNTQFDVPRGHLLKYGVASAFDDFLDDVVKWGVNLNKVDESDNRTVLDYIQFHMQKSAGGALEKKYQGYYDKLRAAGARHRHELKDKAVR